MDDYRIERMDRNELDLAIRWAAAEGWNPGLNDASCFYATDPQGFFVGKLNNKIIATGSAVIYDDHFAFCGFYIVDKKYRDKGYGIELTKARLAYIGQRNAGIDGVMDMIDKYSLLGYKLAHNNARYSLDTAPQLKQSSPHIIPLKQVDRLQLYAYDLLHFPAPRQQFLDCWVQQKKSLALGFVENNQLKGYGVIRACQHGYKVGPLFADSAAIAQQLFLHLAEYAKGSIIFIDIPENNPFAIALTEQNKMTKVFATARMYLKGAPQLETEQIYGITSFELG